MGVPLVVQSNGWMGSVALACMLACGSAGSGAPVEPRAVVVTPASQPERAVDAGATPLVEPPVADAGREIASPIAPPGPSFEGCDGRMPDPRCFAAFPAKVDCPRKFADVPNGAYCGLDGTT